MPETGFLRLKGLRQGLSVFLFSSFVPCSFVRSFVRSLTHSFNNLKVMLCVFPEKNATPALCLRFNLSVLQLPSLLFPSRQGVAAAALELVCIFMTLTSMRTAAPGSRAARPAAGQRHLPLSTPASSTSRHLPSLQGRAWCPPYTQPPESLALEGLW